VSTEDAQEDGVRSLLYLTDAWKAQRMDTGSWLSVLGQSGSKSTWYMSVVRQGRTKPLPRDDGVLDLWTIKWYLKAGNAKRVVSPTQVRRRVSFLPSSCDVHRRLRRICCHHPDADTTISTHVSC
jgi:hypothetical protein